QPLSKVVVGKHRRVFHGAREESAPQRTERHEADTKLTADWQHVGLSIAEPQRVLALQRRNRMDLVCAMDGSRRSLRQPDEPYLAGGDETCKGADAFFDGRLRIDAMKVKEIDDVGPEPAETLVARGSDVLGRAVDAQVVAAARRQDAALGGQDHVAPTFAE